MIQRRQGGGGHRHGDGSSSATKAGSSWRVISRRVCLWCGSVWVSALLVSLLGGSDRCFCWFWPSCLLFIGGHTRSRDSRSFFLALGDIRTHTNMYRSRFKDICTSLQRNLRIKEHTHAHGRTNTCTHL